MNRWTRVNLGLAAIAALLLVVRLWPAAEPVRERLTRMDGADVASIRIERGDRLVLALQRDARGWRLSHPSEAPARAERVAQLLAILKAPVQASPAATEGLAQYGLAPPQAVVYFDRTRLQFGDRDTTQHSRYVLTDDGLRLIDDLYFNLLTLPATHFGGD